MIDLADSNAVYYYHFDGLGSVVALTDANGTCVQTYEYSVYGHVAASDPNHPNPFMFTGRQFDIETGLYYYRARYYNPYLGRFLQTDPVGYGDGINRYNYCRNNPSSLVDPSGLRTAPSGLLHRLAFLQPGEAGYVGGKLTLAYWVNGKIVEPSLSPSFSNLDEFYTWASQEGNWQSIKDISPAGWTLSGGNVTIFLALKVLEFLYVFSSEQILSIQKEGWSIVDNRGKERKIFGNSANGYIGTTIYWDPSETTWQPLTEGTSGDTSRNWHVFPAEAALAHELGHAYELVIYRETCQPFAIMYENAARWAFYYVVPGYSNIWPRPLTGDKDLGWTVEWAWKRYNRSYYLINHLVYHRRY